jgi:hypothetical protein
MDKQLPFLLVADSCKDGPAGCNQFLDTNRIAFSGHAVTQSLQE